MSLWLTVLLMVLTLARILLLPENLFGCLHLTEKAFVVYPRRLVDRVAVANLGHNAVSLCPSVFLRSDNWIWNGSISALFLGRFQMTVDSGMQVAEGAFQHLNILLRFPAFNAINEVRTMRWNIIQRYLNHRYALFYDPTRAPLFRTALACMNAILDPGLHIPTLCDLEATLVH